MTTQAQDDRALVEAFDSKASEESTFDGLAYRWRTSDVKPFRDALSRLLDEQAREQWQPIETAPKDGSSILVYFGPKVGVYEVFWSEEPFCPGIGAWCVTDRKYADRPLRGYCAGDDTHWKPLPSPPVTGATED